MGTATCFLAVKKIRDLFKQKYPQLPYMADAGILEQLPIDARSTQLLPSEWRHVTPLTCYGDGNCLYRYATCKQI